MARGADQSGTAEALPRPAATRDRIITASYACFDRIGIAKTTMEDIAQAANVSRPTVYKYFSSKNDLVDHVSLLETIQLNKEIKRRTVRHESPVDTIVEAVTITARVSASNIYVRRVIESAGGTGVPLDPSGAVHSLIREAWRKLLTEAMRRGELASDLDLDQIVSWLSLSQVVLLMKIDTSAPANEELRAFVRRFIVAPLTAPPHRR